MTTKMFTLEADTFYGWHMLPGYGDEPYFSPIFVERIKPLKRGDSSIELTFRNCFYAEGVQGMQKQLRILRRSPDHLVATDGHRTVIISDMTEAWMARHGRGYQLADLLPDAGPRLALSCVVPGHLYLGPFPHEEHIPFMKALGIDAVLSIVDDRDPHAVAEPVRRAFAWAQVPVLDSFHGGVPTVEDLADAVGVLRRWKAEGKQRVYIHCLAGQGRSPLVAMAYLVHGVDGAEKMRLTKAIAQVSTARRQADPNCHQLRVLSEYVDKALHDPRFDPARYQVSDRVIRHLAPTVDAYHQLRDRFRGALIGLATGDVLGVPLEFKQPGSFRPVSEVLGGGPFGLKPGEWTDDTSMALCLAESLVLKGGFDARDQLERYLAWYRQGHLSSKGRCFDIGITVREALTEFERTRRTDVGCTHAHSAGNGSIMRLAPVPMFYAHDAEAALAHAAASSLTTHAHPEAVDACRYMAGLIVGALQGASKEELLSPYYSPVPGYFERSPLTPAVAAIAAGSFKRKSPPEIRGSGYVVHSFEAALWAFYHGADFEEGCKLAVNLGQDADTTGAVYGQIAGAFYGESGIPARWRDTLVARHRLGWFAEALFVAAQRQTMPAIKQAYVEYLSTETLVASDDPRSIDQMERELGAGLYVDFRTLLETPLSARFDPTAGGDGRPDPEAEATYLFIPEVNEDDL